MHAATGPAGRTRAPAAARITGGGGGGGDPRSPGPAGGTRRTGSPRCPRGPTGAAGLARAVDLEVLAALVDLLGEVVRGHHLGRHIAATGRTGRTRHRAPWAAGGGVEDGPPGTGVPGAGVPGPGVPEPERAPGVPGAPGGGGTDGPEPREWRPGPAGPEPRAARLVAASAMSPAPGEAGAPGDRGIWRPPSEGSASIVAAWCTPPPPVPGPAPAPLSCPAGAPGPFGPFGPGWGCASSGPFAPGPPGLPARSALTRSRSSAGRRRSPAAVPYAPPNGRSGAAGCRPRRCR